MTVRVKRTFEFDAPGERVWEFISDPAKRAGSISVVDRYDISDDGRRATWYLELPIPLVRSTVTVETEDVDVEPPTHVRFVGRSRVMHVSGEHTIESDSDDSCRLVNEFVVDGRLPGVETFFERNLDRELQNLEAALREELEATA